jgi:tetratricopeptide (TPR) repeat protein
MPSNSKGKKVAFFAVRILALAVCLCLVAFAGEFAGLKPGMSKKADADRVLGQPIREVVPGERYDYNPAKHDARRISIKFQRNTLVIESIDLYFKENYPKRQYQEWFKLGSPTRTSIDANGNLVEYYSPSGLALHYTGPDPQSTVEFFSHFDQQAHAQESSPGAAMKAQVAAQALTAQQASVKPSARSYLGLVLVNYEGQGVKVLDVATDSPASRAGLRAGDILLELGSTGFYQTGATARQFGTLASVLPPGKSTRLLVQRGTDRFETALIPEDINAIRQGTEKAAAASEQGRNLINMGDFKGAAGYFEQAISLEPRQAAHYSALAESHDRRGDLPGAIKALQRGVAATPQYSLYALLGFKCREAERFEEAINAFSKAAALMPADVKDIAVFEQLGFSFMKKRRYADALSAFEAAYKINAKSPTTIYFLGGCHDALKNREKAISFYSAYLNLSHDNNNWKKYARRRVEFLTKNSGGGSDAGEKLFQILDGLIKEATSEE